MLGPNQCISKQLLDIPQINRLASTDDVCSPILYLLRASCERLQVLLDFLVIDDFQTPPLLGTLGVPATLDSLAVSREKGCVRPAKSETSSTVDTPLLCRQYMHNILVLHARSRSRTLALPVTLAITVHFMISSNQHQHQHQSQRVTTPSGTLSVSVSSHPVSGLHDTAAPPHLLDNSSSSKH